MVSRLVIIAFEPIQPALLERLGSVMPIWIVDSLSTQPIKRQSSEESSQALFTWFPVKKNESTTDALVRIAFSVDQHHDESSQQPAYDSLWVIGEVEQDRALMELASLGFISCNQVIGGTLFLKLSTA